MTLNHSPDVKCQFSNSSIESQGSEPSGYLVRISLNCTYISLCNTCDPLDRPIILTTLVESHDGAYQVPNIKVFF